MIGYIFAFLTPIFNTVSTLLGKKLLNKEHTTSFVASLAFISFLVTIPMFFLIDYSEITLKFLLILFFNCIMSSTAFILIVSSIRHSEISSIAPLLVLGPGISSLLSLFILKEFLTIQQWIGIFVLIIGAYILEIHKSDKRFNRLNNIVKSNNIIFVLIALVLYGFCSVIDKVLITSKGVSFVSYIAFVHLFIAIIFIIYINYKFSIRDVFISIKEDGITLFIIAIFTVGYRFTSMVAIKYLFVGIVSALKRSSSLLTTIIGGELFHEDNILQKTIACLIMISGIVLLVI